MVPAAGRGVRLGSDAPKALCLLGGEPLLVHAVRAVQGAVSLVVVAAPPDDIAAVSALVGPGVSVVAGGETRRESVARALDALPDDVGVVLVHDAARPLAPVELVMRVESAVRRGAPAVVPVLPVPDTLKEVSADARVVRTLDRAGVRAVQTPQGFRRHVLEQAHGQSPDADVSDDAALVERLGVEVLAVDGAEEAFKVTGPLDLLLAEGVLSRRRR